MTDRRFGRISRRLVNRGEPIRYEDDVKPPNSNALRIPWIVLIAFLLTLMGAGFTYLEQKKADRAELLDYKESMSVIVVEMRRDLRDLRNVLIGPPISRPRVGE